MNRCPKCDAPDPARNGSRMLRRASLGADGRIGRTDEPVQRYRCSGCGHVFSEPSVRDAETTDAVVDAVMKSSVSAAASRFGIDEASVAKMLSEWLCLRDRVACGMPDIVALSSVRILGRDCLLAVSLAEDQLLDLLPSAEALPEWFAGFDVLPKTVAVELDARTVAAVTGMGPLPKPMVAPSVARRAIVNAGLTSFRALVRDKALAGRNYRESATLLRKPDAALTDSEKDDLVAWHPQVRRFRFAFLTLLADLAGASAEKFAATLSQVVPAIAQAAPGCALHRLLTRWGDAIVLGVRHRWVDGPLAAVSLLKADIRRLRPTASFDTLRAILLHSDPAPHGRRPGIMDSLHELRILSGIRTA